MAKVILDPLGDLENEPSALNTINVNSDRIEAAMENTLSRDGSAPNEMNTNLDMNNFRIYNLPYPILDSEPIRKNEYDQELGSILINANRAEIAALEAQALLDSFQSVYLGGRATDPISDGNGNPLTAGDLYYNTTTGKLRYYDGAVWVDAPIQNGLMIRSTAIATAGQTIFPIAGGYTAPYLQVYYNGVLLFPSEYTASNGTTVVLTSGALQDAELSFVKYDAFSVPNALVPSNNLSDVADPAASRTNLGLGTLATKTTVATTDIDNDAVTFAKFQNITDNRLLGRSAGSDGDMQHITVGSGLTLSAGTLSSSAGGDALPMHYLAGFRMSNNVTDATNDIDFTAGEARSSADALNIAVAAMTKRLDAAWAAGTNQGGIDTGSKANSTWYHCHAICKADGTGGDFLFSLSATAPTLPATYTVFRRVGSIRTNGSGVILQFKQTGNFFSWGTVALDLNSATISTSPSATTVTVPPIDGVVARIQGLVSHASAASNVQIYRTGQTVDINTPIARTLATAAATSYFGEIEVDGSGQLQVVSTNSSTTVTLGTIGYIDHRGRE